MSYTKQIWVDGPAGVVGATPITAARLNYLEDGVVAAAAPLPLTGTTAARPEAASLNPGTLYYDTTLGKPTWSNGSVYQDATGTTV